MSGYRWLVVGALGYAACVAMAFGPANADGAVNPVLSGAVADSATTLPGVTAVAVSGHYAYVTGYYAGRLVAVDISNPAEPVIVGASEASNALINATTVNIVGGYAYVVSKNRNGPSGSETNEDGTGNSFTILDIATNPAEPTIVGSLHDTESLFGAYGVAVSGNYAYVASQGCLNGQPCPNPSVGNAFAVIGIGNPASPTLAPALHDSSLPSRWAGTGAFSHATAVAISGDYAYITAAYQDRLTVVSIANPLSPEIVASLKDTTNLSFPVDVTVSGQYAYVADQNGRFTVVNVSNPADPQVVSSLTGPSLSGAYRVRLRGDFAYVSAFLGADVAVVDISNPASPRLVAAVQDGAHLNKTSGLDLDPSGSYLVASSPFLSSQTQSLYPPFALQSGGPTLTGTVSVITLDPAPIAVSIAPESQPPNPTSQPSAAFGFSVNDAVSAVQCQLDGEAWLPCTTATSQSYSGLAAGSHTFAVQATDSAGNTNTASYSWTVTAPANITPPSIPGSPTAVQTVGEDTAPGGLTNAQIASLLLGQLAPPGRSAAIGALLRHDGLSMSIRAPEAGRLTLHWYELPAFGSKHAKIRPDPVLMATGQATATAATTVALRIKLTAAGKRLLKSLKQIEFTVTLTLTLLDGDHVTASRALTLAPENSLPDHLVGS